MATNARTPELRVCVYVFFLMKSVDDVFDIHSTALYMHIFIESRYVGVPLITEAAHKIALIRVNGIFV